MCGHQHPPPHPSTPARAAQVGPRLDNVAHHTEQQRYRRCPSPSHYHHTGCNVTHTYEMCSPSRSHFHRTVWLQARHKPHRTLITKTGKASTARHPSLRLDLSLSLHLLRRQRVSQYHQLVGRHVWCGASAHVPVRSAAAASAALPMLTRQAYSQRTPVICHEIRYLPVVDPIFPCSSERRQRGWTS